MGDGVGTQGGLIILSAPDQRSRLGSNPGSPTKYGELAEWSKAAHC